MNTNGNEKAVCLPTTLIAQDTLDYRLPLGWVAFVQPAFVSPVRPFEHCPACGGYMILAGLWVARTHHLVQCCRDCDRITARKTEDGQWEIDPRAFPGIYGPNPLKLPESAPANISRHFTLGRAGGRSGQDAA